MIKNMKPELEQINTMDKIVIIFISILSFILPIIGLSTAIYLSIKSKVYPHWVRIVAITAIIYQIIIILYLLFIFFFAMHIPTQDITNTVTNQ